MKAADIRRLRLREAGGGLTDERVPRLEDVRAVGAPSPVALVVEVKGPATGFGVRWERVGGRAVAEPGHCYEGLEDRVLSALGRAGLLERATLMAFNPDVLARVRARLPGQRTALLVAAHHAAQADAGPEETIDWAVAAGATDVGLQHTPGHEAGLLAFRQGLGVGGGLRGFDLRLPRGGELGGPRGATLDRTTAAKGAVRALTVAEPAPARTRARDGSVTDEPVPTLAELLDLAAPSAVEFLPEIKAGPDRRPDAGVDEGVLELLPSRDMLGHTTGQAFQPASLHCLR